jgi:hypothetical protein
VQPEVVDPGGALGGDKTPSSSSSAATLCANRPVAEHEYAEREVHTGLHTGARLRTRTILHQSGEGLRIEFHPALWIIAAILCMALCAYGITTAVRCSKDRRVKDAAAPTRR